MRLPRRAIFWAILGPMPGISTRDTQMLLIAAVVDRVAIDHPAAFKLAVDALPGSPEPHNIHQLARGLIEQLVPEAEAALQRQPSG